jgi:glycyl-tRNA synthetase alpha chain
MEVTQFTYFQQVGGFDCNPVSGELTYGLERLAMYVQGVDHFQKLAWNEAGTDRSKSYADVYLAAERQFSAYNFDHANTDMLFRHFADAETECAALVDAALPLPAYDQCIKASHLFNLLDARGVISVTERAAYIGRVRELAKACATAYLVAEGELAAPHSVGGAA